MAESGFEDIGTYVTMRQNTLRSILQYDLFWTSVSGPLGGQRRGCLSSGGSRTDWNCRGIMKEQ